MQHQNAFPSIDEGTAGLKSDPSRLRSYRETRRYHPYGRPIPVLVNDQDHLLNTTYDDEHVVLDVPPSPARRVVTHPLASQPETFDEFEEHFRQNMERVIGFELRVQRLPTVIVEFVARITHATLG